MQDLNIKWRILSIFILILGDTGLILGSLVGIVRDVFYPENTSLTNLNVILLIIGLPIPIIIALYVYIIGLKVYNKMNKNTTSVNMLRKLTWIVISITIYIMQ